MFIGDDHRRRQDLNERESDISVYILPYNLDYISQSMFSNFNLYLVFQFCVILHEHIRMLFKQKI